MNNQEDILVSDLTARYLSRMAFYKELELVAVVNVLMTGESTHCFRILNKGLVEYTDDSLIIVLDKYNSLIKEIY